ncbi:GNAT family N-acetyltransferase [candidate division KSB1 bacterium]|nr:GNAT family N-acetyltransferase [candidate division KSB1 bacterium]
MSKSAASVSVVDLTLENIPELGLFCVTNPKHEGYQAKLKWLEQRFAEGLKLKLVVPAGGGKPLGFIEYVPGEFAWRAVAASDYLFIHCIWVYPRIHLGKGYGSLLVKTCIEDARARNRAGVAVIAGDTPWLPDRRLFQKNGFALVETSEHYELWALALKHAKPPRILDWKSARDQTGALTLACANQCPYSAKAMLDLRATAESTGAALRVKELKSAAAAQAAPSGYGVFSLTCEGRLLADHYISGTRFRNILRQGLK